jgi:arylsulfatase
MATEKSNIVLILADDVGWFDIGAYHRGILGAAHENLTAFPLGVLYWPAIRPKETSGP